jgi:hypothetical protein
MGIRIFPVHGTLEVLKLKYISFQEHSGQAIVVLQENLDRCRSRIVEARTLIDPLRPVNLLESGRSRQVAGGRDDDRQG